MRDIRFLLDENVDLLYRTELLKREPTLTVWRVGLLGTPAKGTLDPDLLLWCEENRFILVTNNRKSMPLHLREHLEQGHHIPGILAMKDDIGIGETLNELRLIGEVSDEADYQDQIVYLPVS